MRWVVTTACFASLLSLSLAARAAPESPPDVGIARSQRAFAEAHALYGAGRYREAMARYEEAYQLLTAATVEARARIDRLAGEALQREALGATFIRVKQEYGDFKERYGLILDEQWIALASEITVDGPDYVARIDDLLDGLRDAMAHERAEAARHLSARVPVFQ